MARRNPLNLRIGPIVVLACVLTLAGLAGSTATGQDRAPLPERPYRIKVHLAATPSSRIDAIALDVLARRWMQLVDRTVGRIWQVERVAIDPAIVATPLDDLPGDRAAAIAGDADKVWVLSIDRQGKSYALEGREWDRQTRRLSERHRIDVLDRLDLPRGLARLALSVFAPVAEVGEQSAGGVELTLQGGAIASPTATLSTCGKGTVFHVFRIFAEENGKPAEVREIPYSYFPVEGRDGARLRCSIVKGISDPLTNRFTRKNRLVAVGIQAADTPTRIRLLAKGDKQPASGYRLMVRAAEEGSQGVEVATTDRDGRATLPSRFADGLSYVRVIGGNDEPMAEFPVMPGETREERTVVFEARPKTLEMEAKLDALRDAILDVVAERSRLLGRMKSRADGNDMAGLGESIKEFRKLNGRDVYEARLAAIQADAERTESADKVLVLTKNARNRLEDTKALIDRYMDDDAFRAYEAALQRGPEEATPPASGSPPPSGL